jgi:hypothetical protein
MNKKFIFLLLLLLPLAGATYAQREAENRRFQFGIRAGGAVNSLQTIMTQDNATLTMSLEGVGWQVGGSACLNITEVAGITSKDQLGVEASLFLADRIYWALDNMNSLYYLELPVTVSYILPLTQKLKTRLLLGPYFGLGIAGSESAFTAHLRRFNFGLTGGIGMDIGRLFAGATYSLGAFNIAKSAPKGTRQALSSSNLVVGWNF